MRSHFPWKDSSFCLIGRRKSLMIMSAWLAAILFLSGVTDRIGRLPRQSHVLGGTKSSHVPAARFTLWDDGVGIDLENGRDLDNLGRLPPGSFPLDRADGFEDWRADRMLTPKQKARLRKLAAFVLDKQKRRDERERAALELGNWGHADAISTLTSALRDQENYYVLRKTCVSALCRIADKRVVEPLIEAIADVDIGYIPEEGLRKITRTKWGGWEDLAEQQRDPMPNPDTEPAGYKAWLLRRQERWRQWWKDNGAKIELDRSAAFEPSGPY